MPVKVRCPQCEKVLNAPDAAQGKAVSCPGCGTKVKVPARQGAEAVKATAKPSKVAKPRREPESEADFLANLDLGQVEDHSSRICPKCGGELDLDTTECPNCGVDFHTGQLTTEARRKKSMKGPDPAGFWGEALGGSWRFMLKNKHLALRSLWIQLVFVTLGGGLLTFGLNISQLPPQIAMISFGFIAFVVYPGWMWHLTNEVVIATMSKKDFLKKVRFESFTCIALGLKAVVWKALFIVQVIPLAAILGGIMGYTVGLQAVYISVTILGYVWLLPFPLVMVHMTMPVQWKGWVSPIMWMQALRVFPQVVYFWLIALGGLIAVTALPDALGVYYAPKFQELAATMREETFSWRPYILPIALMVLAFLVQATLQSFWLLIQARNIGLLGYYFRDQLELITKAREVGYEKRIPPTPAVLNVIQKFQGMMVLNLFMAAMSLAGRLAGWIPYPWLEVIIGAAAYLFLGGLAFAAKGALENPSPSGRNIAIAIALLQMTNVPLGTILGIMAIVSLGDPAVKEFFSKTPPPKKGEDK